MLLLNKFLNFKTVKGQDGLGKIENKIRDGVFVDKGRNIFLNNNLTMVSKHN